MKRPPPRGPTEGDDAADGERLQKVLAQAGLGSRRQLETYIEAGRVSVNGRTARLGDRARPGDVVRVDGRSIEGWRMTPRRLRVLCYHKPVGQVCTRRDPDGRPTVFETLPGLRAGRWILVGRLDVNTSGLLLFTNDGALANALMHPSSEVQREYAVRVYGELPPESVEHLTRGVALDDGTGRFESVVDAGGEGRNHWYHVVVSEGRNRLVRRLWQALGVEVSRLVRVRFGPVSLPRRLRAGRWEDLDEVGQAALLDAAGLTPPEPPERERHGSRPARGAPPRGGRRSERAAPRRGGRGKPGGGPRRSRT